MIGIIFILCSGAHPKSELNKFINAYKSASSRLIKKEYPEIRLTLEKKCSGARVFAC